MINIICIIPSSGNNKTLLHLKKCLKSLNKSVVKEVAVKMLLVTNNEYLREQLLDCQINNFYLVDSALGFSEMNNLAIEESLRFYDSDYYLLINDDVWIETDFFANLLKIDPSKFDLLNPLVFESDTSKIDSFGSEYFTSGYAKNAFEVSIPTQLATAACLVIKTSFLKKMKLKYGFHFNPLLFYYMEDVEFSIRAKAIGGKIIRDLSLLAHHVGSLTSGKKSYFVMYQTYRNIVWVILLTWPTKFIFSHLLSILVVQGWAFIYSLQFSPLLYARALLNTFIHLADIYKGRTQIIEAYDKEFDFTTLFSRYAFRTHHGVTIKI